MNADNIDHKVPDLSWGLYLLQVSISTVCCRSNNDNSGDRRISAVGGVN